jgi:hypothetical protein
MMTSKHYLTTLKYKMLGKEANIMERESRRQKQLVNICRK